MERTVVENVKVYKYRWVILLLFCLHAAINFVQFLQYSIISNLVQKYYNVESFLVDLSGLSFMVAFIIFCIPTNYLIERFSLRWTSIASNGLTALGAIIKYFAVSPNLFGLALFGQFLTALAQIFVLSVVTKLASIWFGPNEVSTASALAVFGTQIGIAIGSVWPSAMVKNSDKIEEIGDGLRTMMAINMGIACAVFLATVVGFRARPRLPPSQSQVNILENEEMPILDILKEMIKNKTYLWLNLIFGIVTGVWTANGIVINTFYLHYFPNSETDLGIITALSVLFGGCLGSVAFGYSLDKWHNFKLTSFVAILGSGLTYIFVALTFEFKLKLATYFAMPIFGFFIGSTLLISFEFATEIMYPVPASYTCSILNSVVNIFTIAYAVVLSLLTDISYLSALILMFVSIAVCSCFIYFVNPRLQRREANLGDSNTQL